MREIEPRVGDAGGVVFPVAPVRPARRVPRVVVVAVLVGGLAFFAGMQVGAWGSSGRTPARVASSASPSAAAVIAATTGTIIVPATPVPVATSAPAPPGSSAFVAGFSPTELIAGLPGTKGCTTSPGQLEVPRTLRDGPRMTFVRSWMIWCPVPESRRQSFVLAVIDTLVGRVTEVPYSFSTAATGSATALIPYAEGPYAGTVTLSADAAGTGLAVAVVLEERLAK